MLEVKPIPPMAWRHPTFPGTGDLFVRCWFRFAGKQASRSIASTQGANHNHTCARKNHFDKKKKARREGKAAAARVRHLDCLAGSESSGSGWRTWSPSNRNATRRLRPCGTSKTSPRATMGLTFPAGSSGCEPSTRVSLRRLRDRTRPAYEPSLSLCTQSSPNTPCARRGRQQVGVQSTLPPPRFRLEVTACDPAREASGE